MKTAPPDHRHAGAPLVAIVGRPNVGKSTLYNRLVGGRPALVHDTPGLTRDRRYGRFDYFGRELALVDTGGLDPGAAPEVITAGIHRQARAALDECQAILFVVDAAAGVTALDRDVAAFLRVVAGDRPIFVCANKVDHPKRDILASELYSLGMGEVHAISAVHGRGIDDLLDALVTTLGVEPAPQALERDMDTRRGEDSREEDSDADDPDDDDDGDGGDDARPRTASARPDEPAPVRVAFLGKPNAGKSSLVNRLLGVERSLVHHEPGTTTDPVDTPLVYRDRSYVLVDTAGIRRKARIDREAEKLSVSLAVGQIERADVVVLVVDGETGPSEQDARLAGMIEERGRALVVALNKCDLLVGSGTGPGSTRATRRHLEDQLHFASYAPIVLISALRGDGVSDLMTAVDRVAREHRRRITTAELNRFFADVCESHPPPVHRGKNVRIHYLTQGGSEPPTFLLWANYPSGVSPSYRRYVKNQLRGRYGFEGTPLRLFVKAKNRAPGDGGPAGKPARRRGQKKARRGLES